MAQSVSELGVLPRLARNPARIRFIIAKAMPQTGTRTRFRGVAKPEAANSRMTGGTALGASIGLNVENDRSGPAV
jgi:hypothetical protein